MKRFHAWLRDRKNVAAMATEILKNSEINTEFDIPYVAGYSNKGDVIYIDKSIPKFINVSGKKIDFHHLLAVHEAFEKAAMQKLGFGYKAAHQIGIAAEKEAVKETKCDWEEYDKAAHEWIEKIGKKTPKSVPPDLDLEPYETYKDAEEKARLALIKKLMNAS